MSKLPWNKGPKFVNTPVHERDGIEWPGDSSEWDTLSDAFQGARSEIETDNQIYNTLSYVLIEQVVEVCRIKKEKKDG